MKQLVIDVAVLDWSGTTSDDREPVYEANMAVLVDHGLPRIPFEKWLEESRMTAAEFLRAYGIQGDAEQLHALHKRALDRVVQSGIRPTKYPDVDDSFSFLRQRDKKIAILSSHPLRNLRQEAQEYGLQGFPEIFVGDSHDKVEGLKYIARFLGVNPNRMIYCGDTIYDVRAAKTASVHSAAVYGHPSKRRGYHSFEQLRREEPEFLWPGLLDMQHALDGGI